MYYAVVDISTGMSLYNGRSVSSVSSALAPGSVYGKNPKSKSEALHNARAVAERYRERGYKPWWTCVEGQWMPTGYWGKP